MKVVIEKHMCDLCKKEISSNFAPGRLVFSYSTKDWAGNGAPAGHTYEELCKDCCERIDSAMIIAIGARTGDKK